MLTVWCFQSFPAFKALSRWDDSSPKRFTTWTEKSKKRFWWKYKSFGPVAAGTVMWPAASTAALVVSKKSLMLSWNCLFSNPCQLFFQGYLCFLSRSWAAQLLQRYYESPQINNSTFWGGFELGEGLQSYNRIPPQCQIARDRSLCCTPS